MNWPQHLEWESDGVKAVINNGRLTLYGPPSMSTANGTVAIGIDLPQNDASPETGPTSTRSSAREGATGE